MWQKIECNANFKQWFNIFLIISEVWQGYESKAYGVLNHNLKLQCKKLSRTRDIPNFPTQGWADTAFYTRNWSETYVIMAQHSVQNDSIQRCSRKRRVINRCLFHSLWSIFLFLNFFLAFSFNLSRSTSRYNFLLPLSLKKSQPWPK